MLQLTLCVASAAASVTAEGNVSEQAGTSVIAGQLNLNLASNSAIPEKSKGAPKGISLGLRAESASVRPVYSYKTELVTSKQAEQI